MAKKLKNDKTDDIINLKILIDKYENINNVEISYYKNIKDFTPISKLKKLEILNVDNTNISDISFIKKIKILKN